MAYVKAKCDFCDKQATYDAKSIIGPWANMCDSHYAAYGSKTKGLFTKLEWPIPDKICAICGINKPATDFYEYTDGKGVKRTRNECKVCNQAERKRITFYKGDNKNVKRETIAK